MDPATVSPPPDRSPPIDPRLPAVVRLAVGVGAACNLMVVVGLVLDVDRVVAVWPGDPGRLTVLFVAGILAAVAAGAAWIAISGEAGSLPAGFLNLAITLAGVGGYLVGDGDHRRVGVSLLVLAAGNLALAGASLRFADDPGPPVPPSVRWSFLAFTLVLAVVGAALVLQRQGVMPWPLDADGSAIVGWIFLGDACYFAYGVLRPGWATARAQLWSFLAYDVVLLPPLLGHLGTVPDELRTSLLVYIGVLGFSAVLALRYVVIDPRTRGWGWR